jgi:ketosteroid isomerase-like protein
MTTAKELFLAYLENIRDPKAAAALFAEDGAVELPYLTSIGIPYRTEGRAAIQTFIENLLVTVPDYQFHNIRVHIETPDQVFGEYDVDATVQETGRPFRQHYAGRLVAKNGKISLLRESLDLVLAAKALFPNGLADIK